MITRLCQEIRFARDGNDAIEVVEVKRGGKYNVILFNCAMHVSLCGNEIRHRPCVLRTPKMAVAVPGQWHDIHMQRMAAFHHNASKHLAIPNLLAYDCTNNNRIGCSYMILQRMNHERSLQEQYRLLNYNLHARYRPSAACDYAVLGISLAGFIVRQENSYRFTHYGTFQVAEDMALKSAQPDTITDRIGLVVKPFMYSLTNSTQANSKPIDFICEILFAQENQMRTADQEFKFRKLIHIALCIKMWEDDDEENHPAHSVQPAVLWHPNFHPRSIYMASEILYQNPESGTDEPDWNIPSQYTRVEGNTFVQLSGVLSYDGCLALPRIMTRGPPSFLWDRDLRIPLEGRIVVKEAFDRYMEECLPGYCEDAYGVMGRIVRALGFYALFGTDLRWGSF
ncbi:ebd030e7-9b8b-4a19-bb8e-bb806756c2e8-CDS [Sclerotinia trifoliorum]|uniref:Ebd030e7-9b8b-4a19-bb8e-bb806756c2e8-CDS n=1 Tax=Sclerotinia trifoliorum TaxID=28548 RepID=A0A8H2VVY2_9HELO|nr:ebd030e7-9b8b-4a19-bb8e-bb806756c2e8-CDS [Sclerotinia trifoliorum]